MFLNYIKVTRKVIPCSKHASIWRSGGRAPFILVFGTTWRWMVSITP